MLLWIKLDSMEISFEHFNKKTASLVLCGIPGHRGIFLLTLVRPLVKSPTWGWRLWPFHFSTMTTTVFTVDVHVFYATKCIFQHSSFLRAIMFLTHGSVSILGTRWRNGPDDTVDLQPDLKWPWSWPRRRQHLLCQLPEILLWVLSEYFRQLEGQGIKFRVI